MKLELFNLTAEQAEKIREYARTVRGEDVLDDFKERWLDMERRYESLVYANPSHSYSLLIDGVPYLEGKVRLQGYPLHTSKLLDMVTFAEADTHPEYHLRTIDSDHPLLRCFDHEVKNAGHIFQSTVGEWNKLFADLKSWVEGVEACCEEPRRLAAEYSERKSR